MSDEVLLLLIVKIGLASSPSIPFGFSFRKSLIEGEFIHPAYYSCCLRCDFILLVQFFISR